MGGKEGSFRIRQARVTDAPALARLFREQDVVDNTYRQPDATPGEVERFLEARPGGAWRRTVAVNEADEPVAFLALLQQWFPQASHVAEFFVLTDPAWRRRGIARALVTDALETAFEDWRLDRLELEVLADNTGAIRLYESLGFQREGVKRRAFKRVHGDGAVMDSIVMSALRDEWSG